MNKKHAHLRAIQGGQRSAVDELFSGKVVSRPKSSRSKKKEAPPSELPKALQKYSDLFAAGRFLEHEIQMKAEFARRQLEQYCLADIASQYSAINRRPSSRTFSGKHSRFKFVFTERTTLTPEKTDELNELNIDIQEHIEVRGIQINYEAIRQHKLETKLREALESLKVSKGVLEEVFTPQVHLKEAFYNVLTEVVRSSLKQGETLDEKILRVLQVLSPATQMRNVETIGLSPKQVFDLINNTEIETDDEVA